LPSNYELTTVYVEKQTVDEKYTACHKRWELSLPRPNGAGKLLHTGKKNRYHKQHQQGRKSQGKNFPILLRFITNSEGTHKIKLSSMEKSA